MRRGGTGIWQPVIRSCQKQPKFEIRQQYSARSPECDMCSYSYIYIYIYLGGTLGGPNMLPQHSQETAKKLPVDGQAATMIQHLKERSRALTVSRQLS